MKRFFLPTLSAVFLGAIVALAQTPPPSTQELQEKVERLSGDVERLTQDNLALRNKISTLSDELSKSREEMTKLSSNTGVQEDMKRMAEEIQKVDKRRAEDNQKIAEQIREIAQAVREAAARPAPTRTSRPHVSEDSSDKPERPEKAYEYVIQSGDTLSTVVYAYNKEFKSKGMKSISMQQVMDANPKVNWNRLQVGQKIVIPAPASK